MMKNEIKELLASENADDVALGLCILKAEGYNDFKEISLIYYDIFTTKYQININNYGNVGDLIHIFWKYLVGNPNISEREDEKYIFVEWQEI